MRYVYLATIDYLLQIGLLFISLKIGNSLVTVAFGTETGLMLPSWIPSFLYLGSLLLTIALLRWLAHHAAKVLASDCRHILTVGGSLRLAIRPDSPVICPCCAEVLSRDWLLRHDREIAFYRKLIGTALVLILLIASVRLPLSTLVVIVLFGAVPLFGLSAFTSRRLKRST